MHRSVSAENALTLTRPTRNPFRERKNTVPFLRFGKALLTCRSCPGAAVGSPLHEEHLLFKRVTDWAWCEASLGQGAKRANVLTLAFDSCKPHRLTALPSR